MTTPQEHSHQDNAPQNPTPAANDAAPTAAGSTTPATGATKPATTAPKLQRKSMPVAPPPPGHKKVLGRIFGISMVVAALLLSFLTWWELDIRPRTDDAYLRANIVGIAANVSGYITELNVVDNQKVNVGDLLFRVDVRPYQAELDLAIASLGLVDLEIIALKDAIVQRDADIVSAEAKALYDVQFLARMEPLLPRQFVTPDQIDAAKRNVRASDAMVQQAKAAASQARANLGQLGDINVRRQKAEANVVEKQLNVGYCEVRSSVAGYVTNFNTSVGQFAQIGMQVFALVDTSNWYLLANYQETDLRGIEPGMAVEVYLMAYPGVRFHGVVQGVGWALYDPNQGSNGVLPTVSPTLDWVRLAQRFPVRIVMDASQDAHPYRMGATATAIVETRQRRQVPDILKPLVPDALESWLETLAVPAPLSPDSPGRGNVEPQNIPVQNISVPNVPAKNIPAQNISAPIAPAQVNTSVDGGASKQSTAPVTPNP